jgi:hypothetical protein
MGKVSEKDFSEMTARLRVRAAGLLRQLDAGAGYRQQIEKELAKRVSVAGRGDAARTNACAACATSNDADARFCKHCGAALSTPNSQ